MIKLTLTEKGGEPRVLTFDKDEITIGRVSGNDIVLAKGNISKRHTRLTKRDGGMEIADLKSTNGTFVNGRKITGPTAVAPSDRIYVGDFLIGIDGPGGSLDAGALHSPASTTSAARRLPVPPPPPPPARGGSSASRLPDDEETSSGGEEEDDELAARPPRAGRAIPPPPPPPPPPRKPTPMASRSLDLDDDDAFPSAPTDAPSEDTGNVGLFQNSRRHTGDEDGEALSRRIPTGNRPGAGGGAVVAQAPSFGGMTGPVASAAADISTGGGAPELEALLADPAVTQILITAPDAALVDRGSGLALHDASLGDSNAVADVLWRYSNNAYPPPPPDNPVVDVRLPDGTRISAAFPPAAPAGVVASIRRTVLPERVLVDLVPGGNKDVQALLDALVATRRNVVVTGDVAALPSVLAAFAREIPADRRVVAIGAAARARSGWIDLAPAADATGMLRVAAALRPDHLVVGELSGPEAAELVLTSTRGQNGILLAIPGRTASEGVTRLGALAAVGLGASTTAPALVASAFDLYVHAVAADGGARIIEIGELRAAGAELALDVALSMYGDGSKRDLASGRLQGRGVSARLGAAVAAAGSPLPSAIVGK
ncbi:MAG TPA: ATPase, T2SS/T4P/T4SS family [Polyangia bacterium]|nr:ATPase, T2SS/T4P/T4SS family [Polyangia bacterium]